MFKAAVGHSNDPDSVAASQEILAQCREQLAGQCPQAGLLFAAPDFEHGLILQAIARQFPGIALIGGTSDGEISSLLKFQQDSVTLIVFCSDEVEFCAAVGRNLSKAPGAIAQQTAAIAQAKMKAPPGLCLTVPESLTASGVEILSGLKQGLSKDVVIVGGTTTDNWVFESTYQFFGEEVLQDALPVLLLSALHLGHGVSTGWTPVGRKSIVTKVSGNVLYEIDGQPALSFYQDYLGDIRPSTEYRLAVFEPASGHWYMRTSNGSYDATTGSITFFADIPEQSAIQIVRSERDEIVDSARVSATAARANYSGETPAAALFFSCTGRLQRLGTRTPEEYQSVQTVLAPDIPCCGFYTNGEIAPIYAQGESQFHNETFVTLLLGTQ